MDERRETGRRIMREVLGDAYVDRRGATTTPFNAPVRQLSEEMAFGTVWARPGLDRRTRSLLCLAMLTALNRPHELKLHLRGALNNGCTVEEIQEALLQTVVYGGFPACIDSVREAEAALAEMGALPASPAG